MTISKINCIDLLHDLYGSSLDQSQVTDIHVTALNHIIQTELEPAVQNIIIEHYQHGRAYIFIADKHGMSRYHINKLIHKALHKLRQHILPEPMPIAIEAMGLTVRAYNSLKRANINTMDELQKLSDEELSKIRNIEHQSSAHIRAAIGETLSKRNQQKINIRTIDYNDIGVCPVCGGSNNHVVEIDNGYGERYYNVECNNCKATWKQPFHTIQIDDGYDDIRDGNGNSIDIIIANIPLLNAQSVIQNAQLCHACKKVCDLNIKGICHYPLLYGTTPTCICTHGFMLKQVP